MTPIQIIVTYLIIRQQGQYIHLTIIGGPACYTTEEGAIRSFEKLFNGDASNMRTLKQYMDKLTDGQIKLMNYMPQYDGTKIVPIKLENNASYYAGTANEPKLVKEVADKLDAYLKTVSRFNSMNLDLKDNKDTIDNVTIVNKAAYTYSEEDYEAFEENLENTGKKVKYERWRKT